MSASEASRRSPPCRSVARAASSRRPRPTAATRARRRCPRAGGRPSLPAQTVATGSRCARSSSASTATSGRRSTKSTWTAPFTCLRCNRDQGADAGIWQTGLRFCHEVADLAGPDPEGRHAHPEVRIGDANKWADIGVSRTRARMDFTETQMSAGAIRLRSLFLHARPGVPFCDGCHAPLEVTVGQTGRLETRCPACHRSARYEVDPKASRMERGFVGAIGDDHRSDRPATDAAPSKLGAPVAIACPGCGAALDLAAKDHFVTCTYCRTPSKIPSRLRAQLFTEGVELEPMWLMFEGPSRARQKLEKKALAAKKRAAAKRARNEERPRADAAARRAEAPTAGAGGMRPVVMLILAVGVLGGIALLMLR